MAKASTTFLLADDDEDFRILVERTFLDGPSDRRLHLVADGTQLRHYLEGTGEYANRAKFPLPHVLILDLQLPGYTGIELLDWLQQQAPAQLRAIRTVVLSGSPDPVSVKTAYASGAHAYLEKVGDWKSLQAQILTLAGFWADQVEKLPVRAE